jgi:hypothetical protein
MKNVTHGSHDPVSVFELAAVAGAIPHRNHEPWTWRGLEGTSKRFGHILRYDASYQEKVRMSGRGNQAGAVSLSVVNGTECIANFNFTAVA